MSKRDKEKFNKWKGYVLTYLKETDPQKLTSKKERLQVLDKRVRDYKKLVIAILDLNNRYGVDLNELYQRVNIEFDSSEGIEADIKTYNKRSKNTRLNINSIKYMLLLQHEAYRVLEKSQEERAHVLENKVRGPTRLFSADLALLIYIGFDLAPKESRNHHKDVINFITSKRIYSALIRKYGSGVWSKNIFYNRFNGIEARDLPKRVGDFKSYLKRVYLSSDKGKIITKIDDADARKLARFEKNVTSLRNKILQMKFGQK